MTDLAIPLCLGDYFGRFRVVGTTPALFDNLVYDIENNRKFEFAQEGDGMDEPEKPNNAPAGAVAAGVDSGRG